MLGHTGVCLRYFTLNPRRADRFPLILEEVAQEGFSWHIYEDFLDAFLPQSPNRGLT